MITEADFYRLIARSQFATAAKFESWMFEEVIPTIRKTGQYGQLKIPTHAEALRLAANAVEKAEKL
jgi:prophage antirepressor-like protein